MFNNFIKEIFWKNDLTYLCLCLPFIMIFMPDEPVSYFVVGGSVLLLGYSWRMTFKKRYIFNSKLKFLALVAVFIAAINFLTITQPIVKVMKVTLEVSFIVLYFSYVMITAYCLFTNAEEHYEGEYHPEFEDMYRANDYICSIYSSMNYNNTFNYYYDRNIDAYAYYDSLYEKLTSDSSKNKKISTIIDYTNYLYENGLSCKQMTKDEFSVFRMFAI
jgi:hypothetical protein